MKNDKIRIENVKSISILNVDFKFSDSNILVVTGKNGIGKTSLVKSFRLIADPLIFQKSSGLNSVKKNSSISFEIDGLSRFSYTYNPKLQALDTRDKIPKKESIIAELSIPYGMRFQQFSLISEHDSEIRANIAASQYERADELIDFLKAVYSSEKFNDLMVTKINKHHFYFTLLDDDFYIREDHFSSGEFFLIQLFRLITSNASLVLVDEVDVALDASAQVRLYTSIKPILNKYQTRLILISHSLAFMNTVQHGELYYLEQVGNHATLERRSFGYIKSDLYGFIGKDKYILVEDDVLSGFVNYLIKKHIQTFFEYEIISIGGEPQINSILAKNDKDRIFSDPQNILVIVDKDIIGNIINNGQSIVHNSPVNDIEVFIFKNRERLLSDITIADFTYAKTIKKTSKTFWKKVISSKKKTIDDLYLIVERENQDMTNELITILRNHLTIPEQI
ncbi:AAA family ATPase [Gallaecimonas pentaromativorans]|uniref:AAA family ATPase n=1 Tax=Gallaecimonas pentaromativorans TaxID=584787 RepID=UPI003A90BDC5